MLNKLFDTQTEAEIYKNKNQLWVMKAEYIDTKSKWALIFDIPSNTKGAK